MGSGLGSYSGTNLESYYAKQARSKSSSKRNLASTLVITMNQSDQKLLEGFEISVYCESPFELSNIRGDRATGEFAEITLDYIRHWQEMLDTLLELYEDGCESDEFPTSNDHPLYRARAILQKVGIIDRDEE